MALREPGQNINRTASKDVVINTPVVEGSLVGWVTQRVGNLGRFVDPSDTAAVTTIAEGEDYTLAIDGTHDLFLTTGLTTVAEGDLLYIDPTDNSVVLADDVAGGELPLGVVESVDASRSPHVAKVNLNDLRAFFPAAEIGP
jgi:hypothetical protein